MLLKGYLDSDRISPESDLCGSRAFLRVFLGLFLTSLVMVLQKGYLFKNGVEFHKKVIGAIANLSKRRPLGGQETF